MTTLATPSSAPSSPVAAPARATFPVVLTLTGLLAMASLYASGVAPLVTQATPLQLCILLTITSLFVPLRLRDRLPLRWGLRVVIYSALITILGIPEQDAANWFAKPEYMARLGVLMAAEFTLRAYLARPPAKAQRSIGDGITVAGMIFLASTATYDQSLVTWLAPAFLALCMLSLGVMRRLGAAGTGTLSPVGPPRSLAVALRILLVTVALAIGFIGVHAVRTYADDVVNWAVRMLEGRIERSRQRPAETGMSTVARLRDVFNPIPSFDRVLEMRGITGERHLRVATFDIYASRTWSPSLTDRPFAPVAAATLARNDLRSSSPPSPPNPSATTDRDPESPEPPPLAAAPGRDTPAVIVSVTLRPFTRTAGVYLALPVNTLSVSCPEPLERDGSFVLRTAAGLPADEWTVELPALGEVPDHPLLPGAVPALTRVDRTYLTRVPPSVDDKVIAIARDAAGQGTPAEQLFRIASMLRTTHKYSLEYRPPPDVDPLSDFILNNRSAHCQYFASAMVVMARAVDIPARFASGFYAHEPTDEGNTIVRQRDAHAWAECYLDGLGWVAIDATPPDGRPDAAEPPSTARRIWEWFTDLPGRFFRWVLAGGLMRLTLAVGAVVVLIMLIRWVVDRLRARRRPAGPVLPPVDPRLLRLASRFDRLLTRHRLPPGPTFGQRLASRTPDDPLAEFAALYARARFNHELDLIPQLQALLRRLESATMSPPIPSAAASPPLQRV